MRIKRMFILMVVPQLLTLLGCKPKTMYGNNPGVGHYYNINGIKIYCEVYGSGEPVLMIHGNGGDISAFTENIPYFAKKYKVIVADSRAHGKSVDDSPTLTFEQMADDFAVLLDTLQISKANIIGWSDGGIIAIMMAMHHPDKVIKLASTGANVWMDSTVFSPADYRSGQKYYNDNKNRVWKTPKAKNAWKLFALDMEQPNIKLTELQQIKTPAFIIAGDHDVITDAHTRLIQQNIPGSKLWIIPNSGHGTLIEHAKEFNKRVDEFFHEK